jgi:hypothetical protein
MEYSINKGAHGWAAKSIIKNLNGFDWEIYTMKTSSGFIHSIAQAGQYKDEGGYTSFSFLMFGDPRYTLLKEKRQATEKAIREIHELGLQAFEGVIEAAKVA